MGTFAPANMPGARVDASSWTDENGNLWLLGGDGLDSSPPDYGSPLNDLWEYNTFTGEWAWMGGSATIGSNCVVAGYCGRPGVYGVEGTPAAANNPGSRGRESASNWTDSNGNFWLFGGAGFDVNGNSGSLYDLWIYEPLPSLPAAATPAFSLPAGTYATPQSVTISDATPGATIYYTTNGTAPTASSAVYNTPITVSSSETIEAIATAPSYTASAIATVNYTIPSPTAALPSFSVPAGSYATAQTVTISDTTPGAVIYYTTDGSTPTTSSNVYNTPITVSASETIEAMATATGYSASQVASAAYNISSSSGETGEWTWMGGSSTVGVGCTLASQCGQPGVYGTFGVPGAGNIPGGRVSPASWTDQSGHEWLFGGWGNDANGNEGELNDLWEFNPSTNEWAWISGSSTTGIGCTSADSCGWPGVYGTLGSPATGNIPGSRYYSTTWVDKSGNFWLFGGYGFDANGNVSALNDLWEFNPSTKEWAWMSGGSTVGQLGVYGTLHSPAAGNYPGSRWSASGWTDSTGNLWLFGGSGYDVNGHLAYLNDLWEFNPSTKEWARMGGNSTVPVNCSPGGCSMPGVNGTLGKSAAGNMPEGREYAATWTDSTGNLWLFGGDCFIAGNPDQLVPLNDLWEFSPSSNEWAWMGGANTTGCSGNQPGGYGTLGVPAAGNIPAGLRAAATWTDGSGNFWLFGGWSVAAGGLGVINYVTNLWEFSPSTNEWTWMGGSASGDPLPGVYGTLGTPAAANTPGGRQYPVGWTDKNGNLWLIGGLGWDANDVLGYLNDVWKYENVLSLPAAATPTFNPPAGVYTTAQSVTIGDTTPGAVIYYATDGTTPTTSSNVFSTAITIASTETIEAIATAGDYSPSAIATATYTITFPSAATPTFSLPAGSYASAQTVTISDTTPGAVIYYTINGTPPTTSSNVYSTPITVSISETIEAIAVATGYSDSAVAMASYTITASTGGTGEWTWVGGSSMVPNSNGGGFAGVYGTMGTPSAANIPGSRTDATTWTDGNGNLWLFGGGGCDSAGNWGSLNDLWEYDISTREWTWISGSSTLPSGSGAGVGAQPGVYGTLGVPAAGNVPGGRAGALGWTDASGNLWLFGGAGHDSAGIDGYLNDLWKFSPSTSEWTWVTGSSTLPNNYSVNSEPGVYGTLGVPAPGNTPGGRVADVGWTDRSGNLWLFGAGQYTFDGLLGALNDLWEFSPSTGEWTWISGSNAMSCNTSSESMQCTPPVGVYRSVGVPAAGNTPGSRELSVSWVDGSGNLWLFGGISDILPPNAVFPTNISWNDLWEFNPLTRQWAWVGGSSGVNNCITTAGVIRCGQPGVYGTLGVFAAANSPGGRSVASGWTDDTGNFWLFGGQGPDSAGNVVDLNSLWEFNPSTNEWAWVGGSSTADQPGVYGTLGVPAAGNIPGARTNASAWKDQNGNFWLFGGWGFDSADMRGYPNDLWRYGSATSNLPVAATPTFSVPAGTYATAQTVTIGDTTQGAVIYYTTDGTTPTTSSNVFSTAITVASTETIEAIATASGYSTSAVASATYTIAIPTTTILSASATTPTAGQTLTLTATVTAASGTVPAGTITFLNGATSMGTGSLNSSGEATLTLTPAVGAYSITASYSGSPTDLPSASVPPVVVNVIAATTMAALTASPNPASFGANVAFTATVASSAATPMGSVSFYDGAVLIGTANLAAGVAMYTTSALSVGSHNITAQYEGTASFAASTSNLVVEVISPADFGISAAPASQSVYTGQAATYTVTIKPGAGFNLPVALNCSELPANTTCSFSPATIPAGGKNSTLVVETTAPHKAATAFVLSSGIRVTSLAGLLLLLIPGRLRRRHGRWPVFLLLLAFFVAGAAITGCGTPSPLSGGTPVGAQTITVTGISTNGSQALTHTASVTLNVKSLF